MSAMPLVPNLLKRESDRQDVLAKLTAAGVRITPYPFASGLAVVSDIDSSDRGDFTAYVSQLVGDLGLDFGDSCFLPVSQYATGRTGCKLALALLPSDDLLTVNPDHGRNLDCSLTSAEALHQFYLGNVDHFHGIGFEGPRITPLRDPKMTSTGTLRFDLKNRESATNAALECARIQVLAIALQVTSGDLPADLGVSCSLLSPSGEVLRYNRIDIPAGRWTPRFASSGPPPALFAFAPDQPGRRAPLWEDVAFVEIAGAGESVQASGLRAYSVGLNRPVLLTLLDQIYRKFKFRTNTIIDHAAFFFVSDGSAKRHAQLNKERSRSANPMSLYAMAEFDDLYYSNLADDPKSVAYILPELRDNFGLRFANPAGYSGERDLAFVMTEIVAPTTGRDGTRFYFARRSFPSLPRQDGEPNPMEKDMGTRTFAQRIDVILDQSGRQRDRLWPFYTHLGNLQVKSERTSPYFSADVMRELQDRVYNISGTIDESRRIWFTKATLAYDYSLMLQSISKHVERPDQDTIKIQSWYDDNLEQVLPVTPHQLNGLTFYVGDRANARVFLDQGELTVFTRNPADATNRDSITLVGVGASHTVLDDCNPVVRNATLAVRVTQPSNAVFDWVTDKTQSFRGTCHARLRLEGDGVGGVSWRPQDLTPIGAQYFTFAVKCSNIEARSAILLETRSGGRFLFGSAMPELEDSLTARYECTRASPGEWRLNVVPLHDLAWSAGSSPGGPLPSHQIAGVHLLVSGPAGTVAAFDQVQFFRPSTVLDERRDGMVIVGGRIHGKLPDATVHIGFECDGHSVRKEAAPDARGCFIFSDIPVGSVVELSAVAAGQTYYPRRGFRFDVWGDDVDSIIDPAFDPRLGHQYA